MKQRVLLMEGAGMSYEIHPYSDIGNYRCRTVFTNDKGKKIYLEIKRCLKQHLQTKIEQRDNPDNDWGLHIYADIISTYGGKSEKYIDIYFEETRRVSYGKNSVLRWINENLDCSFTDLEVLDDFEDYRVHAGRDSEGIARYNCMEDHVVNRPRTAARKAAYDTVDAEFKKICNEKYSVISVMEMTDEHIKIRCHAAEGKLKGYERERIISVKY